MGSGVVFRHFGRSDYKRLATDLQAACWQMGHTLLIGQDWQLARKLGADGVHLPERLVHMAPRLRKQFLLVTTAAHSRQALLQAQHHDTSAVFLSPVFKSNSPSAGKPIGPERATRWAHNVNVPIIALGGMRSTQIDDPFYGVAGIDVWVN